ncbi:ribosomal large subunit pseudouridine synthase B [Oxobacter pfennigii]|uniref:Pseudouridine synthase n=1 Tax=Oxobacter pfennigii TaxID=36849 RepID=A0A0N8NT19_9CLOT|nr:ribosomal large subunit pseudouridine synthase B [Oxobacter pfennigii]
MAETQRLDKLLGNLGYGTRKEVKKLIKDKAIEVDGKRVDDPGMHVDPAKQGIEVFGEKVNYRKYIYIIMNKPQGVISATEDTREETVIDILPEEYLPFSPAPVGRLDKDTVGLLLLTNDGQLAHMLLSPKKHVPKVYYARIAGKVTQNDVEAFKEGVILDDGYKTLPAKLEIIESDVNSIIEVEIYEGKYHQVKRMFEAVGKKVTFLMRKSMGPLKLSEDLKPGQSRELTNEELNALLEKDNI